MTTPPPGEREQSWGLPLPIAWTALNALGAAETLGAAPSLGKGGKTAATGSQGLAGARGGMLSAGSRKKNRPLLQDLCGGMERLPGTLAFRPRLGSLTAVESIRTSAGLDATGPMGQPTPPGRVQLGAQVQSPSVPPVRSTDWAELYSGVPNPVTYGHWRVTNYWKNSV